MAKSMVEKYEQILSADPGSMVFVELAKALLDRGDSTRAIEVCRKGLDYHPDSIVGRVLWGKALLNIGRPADAMDQFDQAVGIERENPYAYNLIGEVLLHKQLYRSALPILKKAVTLQPGDARVRQWLDQAQRALGGAGAVEARDATTIDPAYAGPGNGATAGEGAGGPVGGMPAPAGGADPFEQAMAAAGQQPGGVNDRTLVDVRSPVDASGAPLAVPPSGAVMPGLTDVFRALHDDGAVVAGDPNALTEPPTPRPAQAAGVQVDWGAEAPDSIAGTAPAAGPAPAPAPEPAPAPAPAPSPDAGALTQSSAPTVASGPAPAAEAPKPKKKEKRSALDFLDDIPDAPAPAPQPTFTAGATTQRAVQAHAVQAAAEYEKELRDRLYAEQAKPKGFFRRFWWLMLIVAVVGVGGVAAFGAYKFERVRNRDRDIKEFTAQARNGLARDTLGAYRASVKALDEVLDLDPENAVARALKAQALANLAAIYGTGDVDRDAARVLLDDPKVQAAEPEAVLAARWALAGLTVEPAARRAVEDEILEVKADGAGPMINSLAGAALLARNQPAEGIERLNAAVKAGQSHVPTLVRIGDYHRSRGEHEDAIRLYGMALTIAEDHPGAALGISESKLAANKPRNELASSVEQVDKLGDGEQVPVVLRPNLFLVRARLLSATNDRKQAVEVLDKARDLIQARAELVPLLADAYLQAGALQKAEDALDAAVKAKPGDVQLRQQLAQVLLERENFKGVIRLRAGEDDRALHLLKGIAHYRMGDLEKARAELKATASKGENKLPVNAVIFLALADLAAGEKEKARANLERLGTGARAKSTGRWAYSLLLVSDKQLDKAEAALKEAIELDPRFPETRCQLGRLYASTGRVEQAIAELREAVDLNPFHKEARAALAEVLLEKRDFAGARVQFEELATIDPAEGSGLGGLARVFLAEGKEKEAREQAQKAVLSAAQSASAQHALGEVAAAQGDHATAVKALRTATRLDAADARLWRSLGEALLAQADGRGAKEAFAKAAALQDSTFRTRLGTARVLTVLGVPKEAEKQLRALVSTKGLADGEQAQARAALAAAMLAQGKPNAGRAAKEAKAAQALDDASPAVHLVLARALDLTNDLEGARASFAKASSLAPRDPDVHLARGNFLAYRGNEPEEAIKELELYLELAPRAAAAANAKKTVAFLQKKTKK